MSHDALGYARDTWVVDVDDSTPAPPRTRVPTEDLMHVYTMGKWHRRTPDLATTACDLRIDGQRFPLRREALVGDLCGTCFTEHERNKAADANAKADPDV